MINLNLYQTFLVNFFFIKIKEIYILINFSLKIIEKSIKLKKFKLKMNYKFSINGYLTLLFNEILYYISNLNFNIHTTNLACQYFGYQSGLLFMKKSDKIFNTIQIICNENITNFKNCIVKNIYYSTLSYFQSTAVSLICFQRNVSCPKSILPILNVYAYLKSCYFIFFEFEKYLTSEESYNFCKKNGFRPVGISFRDEAEFVFNLILQWKLQYKNDSSLYQLNIEENRLKIPYRLFYLLFL